MLYAKFQNHRPSGSEEEHLKRFLLFIAMAVIWVMCPWPFKLLFPFPKHAPHEVWLWLAIRFQRCLNNMVIYMYIALGQRQTTPWGQFIFFHKHKFSVHLHTPSKSPPPSPFYQFSAFICKGDLYWPCRKIGQGHPRVMFYINYVELHCLMLHTKFQNHRPSGSFRRFFKGFCYL